MIARFFFPLLTPHDSNTPQILIAGQGRLTTIAMLPDFGVLARGDVHLRLRGQRRQHGINFALIVRAIARQAEAERERRAKIIHAEGEYSAAAKLAMAAEVIQQQPVAIQLRYLQTLVEIGTEKNTTIVFPLPLDILSSLDRALGRMGEPTKPANQ